MISRLFELYSTNGGQSSEYSESKFDNSSDLHQYVFSLQRNWHVLRQSQKETYGVCWFWREGFVPWQNYPDQILQENPRISGVQSRSIIVLLKKRDDKESLSNWSIHIGSASQVVVCISRDSCEKAFGANFFFSTHLQVFAVRAFILFSKGMTLGWKGTAEH